MLFRGDGIRPVEMEIGPNGDLYAVDIAFGRVRRIRYNTGNEPPVASITANPAQGPLPLSVSFSATASFDPNGGSLSYRVGPRRRRFLRRRHRRDRV